MYFPSLNGQSKIYWGMDTGNNRGAAAIYLFDIALGAQFDEPSVWLSRAVRGNFRCVQRWMARSGCKPCSLVRGLDLRETSALCHTA